MATLFRSGGLLQRLSNTSRRTFTPMTTTTTTPTSTTLRSLLSSSIKSKKDNTCLLCQFSTCTRPTRLQQYSARQYRFATTKSSSSTSTSPPTQESIAANETLVSKAPNVTNYYTIFPSTLPSGPPPNTSFDIPQGPLRREFLQLQNSIHPDKYSEGSSKQRAEALSARINEAYRTLVDPLSRAQYILREFHDIDVTAEDSASKHALDPETLMEVMSVQETIEEVVNSPDAEGAVETLKLENREKVAECVKVLGEAFDRGDIEGARRETVRLRFWYSVGQGLKEWEPGMSEIRLVH